MVDDNGNIPPFVLPRQFKYVAVMLCWVEEIKTSTAVYLTYIGRLKLYQR